MSLTVNEKILIYCANSPKFKSAIEKRLGRRVNVADLLKRKLLSVVLKSSFVCPSGRQYATTRDGALWVLQRHELRNKKKT